MIQSPVVIKMKIHNVYLPILLFVVLIVAAAKIHAMDEPANQQKGFWFKDSAEQLHIYFKQQRIATYLKKHEQLTRRALVNVQTPNGIQVTRNFPPRQPADIDPGYKGEEGIIHPHMHPGIWLGFGDVDGNDYWRLKAPVQFDGFVQKPEGDEKQGGFAARNLFMSQDSKRVVCVELTRYQFTRVPNGLRLNIKAHYQSDQRDFYFGDQEESGLAVRVASPIRVSGGNGTILNDRGEKNGAEVWGKEAKWFDYYGTIKNRQVGVMVMPDPGNSRPSWLHARDYGLVVTNPFPKQPRERREPYIKTQIRKGQPFKLAYAILFYDLPKGQQYDRAAEARKLMKSFEKRAVSNK